MTKTTQPRTKRSYYVTVRDGGRTALLLGPFQSHKAALAQVGRGRKLADEATPWAAFYAFGTSSVPAGTGVKTVFGK
jgi:hypothetical protein